MSSKLQSSVGCSGLMFSRWYSFYHATLC